MRLVTKYEIPNDEGGIDEVTVARMNTSPDEIQSVHVNGRLVSGERRDQILDQTYYKHRTRPQHQSGTNTVGSTSDPTNGVRPVSPASTSTAP